MNYEQKYLNSMNNKDNERLIKNAIAFLKSFADEGYENAVECIDWLEKQGKSADFAEIQNEMKVAFDKGYITAVENMEKLIRELKNRINYDKTSIRTNPSEIQGGQINNE